MSFKSSHAMHTVHFSGGWETTEADWDALVRGVAKVHAESHSSKTHPAA